MAERRRPVENHLREQARHSGYQHAQQRAPVHQAPRPRLRPQSPNHGHHLNADQALHLSAYDVPFSDEESDDSSYDPQPVGRGYRRDNHQHNRSGEVPKASPRPQQPNHLQPDPRLPTDGSYPSDPIYLSSPDGFVTHSLLLLSPLSDVFYTTLAEAKKAREPTSDVPAEDVVERAMENRTLQHISDGPSGGIWVVAQEKPEVVACLVAEMQGGWEILGVGKGGNEGMIFLRHPCGFGPEAEAEMKKKTKTGRRTERADVAKKVRFEERNREEQRAWESEEDDEEDPVWLGGRNRNRGKERSRESEEEEAEDILEIEDRLGVRFADLRVGRPREGAHNVDRGQHVERGRAADRAHRERKFDGDERIGRIQEPRRNQQRSRDRSPPPADTYRSLSERTRLLQRLRLQRSQ